MEIVFKNNDDSNEKQPAKDTRLSNTGFFPLKPIAKPDYRFYIRSSNCQFDVFADNVIVYSFHGERTSQGTGFNGELPVDHILLRPGKHVVNVKMYPKYGDSQFNEYAFLKVHGHRIDFDRFNEEKSNIFLINIPERKKGNENLPIIKAAEKFDITVPFDLTGWNNSINLRREMDSQSNFIAEIDESYRKLYRTIQNRDFELLRLLMADFMDIRRTVYYLNEQEAVTDWNEYIAILSGADFELAPLPRQAELHFGGYGKLAMLLGEDKLGIIRLNNKKNNKAAVVLDFKFQRKTWGERLTLV